MLKAAWFVFQSDLKLLLRRSQEWLHPLGFFLIVITLFPLTFSPDPAFLEKYTPGCIWIAALFASLLSIQTVFYTELEDGHLEQLLLSEIPLALLLFAKLTAQWLILALPIILLTPLIGYLFHLSSTAIFALFLSLLLGTPILTLIGSLGVCLTLGLKQQGVLLGLLILPLITPVLIFGVNMVTQAQAGLSFAAPAALLAALSVLAITLLPFAMAATLRISMDD